MQKDLNQFPYYDDFAEDKNFYQILFKPGFSVQARELTQLQSVLRNQIKKFGDHIFKHGSVVIPGNSYAEIGVSYIKIDTPTIDVQNYVDAILTSTSGVTAVVKHAVASTTTDPATLYVSYLSGSATTAAVTFQPLETLTSSKLNTGPVTIQEGTSATGFGSVAYVNNGVYYINGTFASVQRQAVVIDKYSTSPSAHVLLKIEESFVTSFEDETLLDPSQGSLNFAAPGADRLRITLTLVTLPIDSEFSEDYVELMRYREGTLEEHSRYPKYNELEKQLARRTFDESGDYVVTGFSNRVQEHLKTGANGGYFPDPIGNPDLFVFNVAAGKAYIQGFEVEKLATTPLIMDKARTADHIKLKEDNVINPDYGSFFYVSMVKNLPSFSTMQIIELWNDEDPLNGSATQVGTARAIAIDYFSGDPTSQNSIYKMYVTDLDIIDGFSIQSIGGIRYSGDSTGSARVLQRYTINASAQFEVDEIVRVAPTLREAVVHSFENSSYYLYKANHLLEVPNVLDNVTGVTSGYTGEIKTRTVISVLTNSSSLFRLPLSSISEVRNGDNEVDIQYTVWNTLTITTDSSGNGSATISEGFINPIEVGGVVAASSAGIVPTNRLSLNGLGNILTITGGPVSTTVRALVAVTKEEIQPKQKTLRTGSITVPTPGTRVLLQKADIYTLDSVIGPSGDITSRYKLDNGQRDLYYGVGAIDLVGAAPGGSITVNFTYFEHSLSGDYFTVDSYSSLGADYISKIPFYKPKNENFPISLQNVLDFRPRFSDTGVLSGATASPSDLPVPEYRISTSAKYFVSRIDTIYLDKDGRISIIRGTPAIAPRRPTTVPPNSIELYTVRIPEYTYSLRDVEIKNTTTRVYKMKDVGKIDERLASLENSYVLTAAENDLLNYSIKDAVTGLDKFKSGYVTENFRRIEDGVADVTHPDFNVTYLPGKITAPTETYSADLKLTDASADYVIRDGCIMLPYTEVKMIEQPLSSRVTNLNPFLVINWEGNMTISPEFDFTVESTDLPVITRTEIDQVVKLIPVERERFVPSSQPPIIVEVPTPLFVEVPVAPPPTFTLVNVPVPFPPPPPAVPPPPQIITIQVPVPAPVPPPPPVVIPPPPPPQPVGPVEVPVIEPPPTPEVPAPVVIEPPPIVFEPFVPAPPPVEPPPPPPPPPTVNIVPEVPVAPEPDVGIIPPPPAPVPPPPPPAVPPPQPAPVQPPPPPPQPVPTPVRDRSGELSNTFILLAGSNGATDDFNVAPLYDIIAFGTNQIVQATGSRITDTTQFLISEYGFSREEAEVAIASIRVEVANRPQVFFA